MYMDEPAMKPWRFWSGPEGRRLSRSASFVVVGDFVILNATVNACPGLCPSLSPYPCHPTRHGEREGCPAWGEGP